jgi:CheY-like chemotaxis protein
MVDIHKTSVLLVEDDQNVRTAIRSMLTEMGVNHVFEAKDGRAALQYFEHDSEKVNLIICDWNMPHKTGIELLREVRQTRHDLPFLMITARADQQSVQAAKESHVTAYIRKPFTFDDMKVKMLAIMKDDDEPPFSEPL